MFEVGLELDLDVEERGALFLLGLRGDPRDLARHDVGRQRADLDAGGHARVKLADVDLVHRALEDQVGHVGDRGELGARLVRGQRNDRVSGVDGAREDRAGRGCADDRLHVDRLGRDASVAREVAVLLGPVDRDLGELVGFALDVEIGRRKHAVLRQLLGAVVVGPGAVERRLRRVELAIDVGQLLRRRVRRDLEQRIAGLDAIADVDHAPLDDSRDLRLDRELLPGLDLTDRQGLFGDRALLDRDELQVAVALAAARQGIEAGRGRHEDE